MSKSELEQMDPQHRQLLEVARECVDDAGEVNWRGSMTGVYAGSFGEDWAEMFTKDSQQVFLPLSLSPRHANLRSMAATEVRRPATWHYLTVSPMKWTFEDLA